MNCRDVESHLRGLHLAGQSARVADPVGASDRLTNFDATLAAADVSRKLTGGAEASRIHGAFEPDIATHQSQLPLVTGSRLSINGQTWGERELSPAGAHGDATALGGRSGKRGERDDSASEWPLDAASLVVKIDIPSILTTGAAVMPPELTGSARADLTASAVAPEIANDHAHNRAADMLQADDRARGSLLADPMTLERSDGLRARMVAPNVVEGADARSLVDGTFEPVSVVRSFAPSRRAELFAEGNMQRQLQKTAAHRVQGDDAATVRAAMTPPARWRDLRAQADRADHAGSVRAAPMSKASEPVRRAPAVMAPEASGDPPRSAHDRGVRRMLDANMRREQSVSGAAQPASADARGDVSVVSHAAAPASQPAQGFVTSIAAQIADPLAHILSEATAARAQTAQLVPAGAVPNRGASPEIVHSLDILLKPEGLGSLRVKIEAKDGRLTIALRASDTTTAKLLMQEQALLGRELSATGHAIEALSITAFDGSAASDSRSTAAEQEACRTPGDANSSDGGSGRQSADGGERQRPAASGRRDEATRSAQPDPPKLQDQLVRRKGIYI